VRHELAALHHAGRTVDLTIEGGRIRALRPSPGPARALLLPLLTDAHVHLDKTLTVHRTGAAVGDLFAAIERAAADRVRWSEADIRARAGEALARAEAAGIGALRTHVDWDAPAPPRAWDVLGELAEEWRGRIAVQRASLTPLDRLADPEEGAAIAARVARSGGVLGAFVYRNEHLPPKLEAVFDLARRHDLDLDFHVDEGLDRDACGFDTIVALTRRHGYAGRVLTGHACALAIRPEAEVARLLEEAAEAGIAHTVLPTTNGWLQDATPGRTPRLRGLAPIQEMRAAGVPVAIGLDNVRDAFFPYGDYDPLDAWRLAVLNARLDPADWLDAITTIPGRATRLAPLGLSEGAPADFLVVETASPAELVSSPRAARTVWRAGSPVTAPEPALA
jgi:cytosine/creatinine deaminase